MKALSKTNRKRADKLKTAFDSNTTMSAKLKADGEKRKAESVGFKGTEEEKAKVLAEGEAMIKKSEEITETNNAQKLVFIQLHSSEGHKQYQKRIGLA